jgi:hypothetical protein
MRIAVVTLGFVLLSACSKPSSPPATTPETAGDESPPAEGGDEPPPAETGGNERPGMSAAACEEQGGKVVGDIGDGATQRPDYKCPDSGASPIGSITADPGGPMGVEGAVCCK